jgi:hypothetical protein
VKVLEKMVKMLTPSCNPLWYDATPFCHIHEILIHSSAVVHHSSNCHCLINFMKLCNHPRLSYHFTAEAFLQVESYLYVLKEPKLPSVLLQVLSVTSGLVAE